MADASLGTPPVMTSPGAYALLGIDHDVDERGVKRAYAGLLKTTRPDEDPEGFQRLNEAYRVALAGLLQGPNVARPRVVVPQPGADSGDHDGVRPDAPLRPSHDGLDGLESPAPPRGPPPLPHRIVSSHTRALDRPPGDLAHAPPAFDHVAFSRALVGRAAAATPQDLRQWLVDHPDLVSLQAKHAVVPEVVQRLEQTPPLPSAHLNVVLVFFGLDEVTHAYPALYHRLETLRTRSRLAHPTWGDLQFRESAPRRREHNTVEFNPMLLMGIAGLVGLLSRCQGAG